MKGILLAGGTGSRLRPISLGVCKQLLPVFDKPMVYYPLTALMLAGVRDILVITTPQDAAAFERLLGDGRRLGVRITWAVQAHPRGIADALVVGASFLDGDPCMLVLGDNLLYGAGLAGQLASAASLTAGARVFAYAVADPSRYGVVRFEGDRPVDIVEKPVDPPSRFAVPGMYVYDGTASARAAALEPSARGEVEITDLNRQYLAEGALDVVKLGRGVAWLDMGTPENLLAAGAFVETIQARQGWMIGSPEEVAWRQGWLGASGLADAARAHEGTGYGRYLGMLATESM